MLSTSTTLPGTPVTIDSIVHESNEMYELQFTSRTVKVIVAEVTQSLAVLIAFPAQAVIVNW